LPALVGGDVPDPWLDLENWVGSQSVRAAEERSIQLGLPIAAIPVTAEPSRAPVLTSRGGRRRSDRRVVLDLTSLWAGPLCAHLLGGTGARVIKVESADRLDGARRGPAEFFDLLHAGHESVVLDFGTEPGRTALAALAGAADLVLEASRPRALDQLGLDAAEIVARGTSWVSITAYGRDDPNALRVGFGDDVAAGAGLICWDGDHPIPVGDAVADPLAGVVAAAAAAAALRSPDAWMLDVSMHDVAAFAATVVPDAADLVQTADEEWEVRAGDQRVAVAPPVIRPAKSAAAPAGRDTDAVVAEFLPG
jgi:crotonobetainyl-CoA:carnitine CoA-transferase CaiB-like acyl-CoA transferase